MTATSTTANDKADPLKRFRAGETDGEQTEGVSRAMLVLRFHQPHGEPESRERWAFAYGSLQRIELVDPSQFVLVFLSHRVTVTGQSMDVLFERVAQFKVGVLQERDPDAELGRAGGASKEPVINTIEVQEAAS